MLTCVTLRINKDRCGSVCSVAGARLEKVDMLSVLLSRCTASPYVSMSRLYVYAGEITGVGVAIVRVRHGGYWLGRYGGRVS